MNKRVLAVGKSRRVLSKLASALTQAGFDARWTNDPATASQRFHPGDVDLVAFGRGVSSEDRRRLQADFSNGNPAMLFVDGLAPRSPRCSSRRSRARSRPSPGRHRSWSGSPPVTARSPSASATTATSR